MQLMNVKTLSLLCSWVVICHKFPSFQDFTVDSQFKSHGITANDGPSFANLRSTSQSGTANVLSGTASHSHVARRNPSEDSADKFNKRSGSDPGISEST